MKTVGYYTTPRLDEYEAQRIRTALDTGLEWLDNSYPIAHELDSGEEVYPVVYANNGSWDSYDLRPNDTVDSYCFFESNGFEIGDDNDINTYNLAVVFWVNLEDLDSVINEDYTSQLISDVVRILKSKDCVNIAVDYDPFSNYNFQYTDLRRYTSFRISFTVYGDNNACNFDVT